jgi:hypothetical protein
MVARRNRSEELRTPKEEVRKESSYAVPTDAQNREPLQVASGWSDGPAGSKFRERHVHPHPVQLPVGKGDPVDSSYPRRFPHWTIVEEFD